MTTMTTSVSADKLQADLQKAIAVMFQFMIRLMPLAMTKQIPEGDWDAFSNTFDVVKARMVEVEGFTTASQSGKPFDPKAAITSIFGFKAAVDDLHGSLDKLLVLTKASDEERASVRELLVVNLQTTLDQQEEQFKQVLAGSADKNPS